MTAETPRGKLIQGGVLILLAIFTVVQAVAFSVSDGNQQDCMEEKFSELSVALKTRSAVTDKITRLETKKSNLTTDVMLAFSEAAENPRADHQKELIAALLKYKSDIGNVDAKIEKATEERNKTPLPPYPVGSCNG